MRRLLLCLTLLWTAVPASAQTYRTDPDPATALDDFGSAIAISGNAVFVGEPNNTYAPGVVHVYGPSTGAWSVRAQLTASDAGNSDFFGASLAADGDDLLVGALRPHSDGGQAYLFRRTGADWIETARLAPAGITAQDGFGRSVALQGDVALVSAPGSSEAAGAVYVFRRTPATESWSLEATLAGSGAGAGASFGSALALDEEHAYVGAPGQGAGLVYVFEHDAAAGTWNEVARVAHGDGAGQDRFGSALAAEDGYLFASAPIHDRTIGAVYGFREDAEGWTRHTRLVPFDGEQQYRFGSALALQEGELWIGAPGAGQFAGSVYRYGFAPDTGEWAEADKLRADALHIRDFFAGSVAADGDVAAVGVTGAEYGAGAVVIFARDAQTGGWAEQTTLRSEPRGLDPITGDEHKCSGGEAGMFDCSQVDLVSFLPIAELGGSRGVRLNDIWGWTDPQTGREYAVIGRVDGTSFVDVSDPSIPRYLGNLPRTEGTPGSSWRDIKVYRDHAYIVADNAGEHGMQVFDLTRLRDVQGGPATFTETAIYDRINSAHNVVINTETGFAYTVGNSGGGETCGGGLHMINIQDPANPVFAGCFSDPNTGRMGTGYTHDAQCVVYRGPDQEHQAKEICLGSNETALSIADVTDKGNPVALSSTTYPNVSYTHQGWITEDHQYFFVNDELDELSGNVSQTRTLIWDITDLDDPQLVKEYYFGTESTDHNLYILGDYMYQSNYVSGLRIHDVSDPENPVEVGYFDTTPIGDNAPGFAGSWSNYPFFKSGIIAVSSIGEGLFLLKKSDVGL